MPIPQRSDDIQEHQTIRLSSSDLDGGGGCRLSGLEGTIRISGGTIQALDIEASPGLEALDLSDCRDDLRLHFCELPSLRWVRLPRGEIGATIELALPPDHTPISPLILDGPVADFGVCAPWLIQPWRLDRPVGKRPVKGLAIGPPAPHPPSRGVAAHLVLGRGDRKEKLSLDCRGIGHLLIMGGQFRELELRNASLERLQVSECPRLERLVGNFQAREARLNLCKRLERVGGSGQALEIAIVQSPRLDLDGRWLKTHLALADCRSLGLKHRTRLELESLPTLVEIDTNVDYDVSFRSGMFGPNVLTAKLGETPGELTKLVDREKSGFGERSRLSTHWIEHLASGERGLLLPGALSNLRDIALNGVDRGACWLIRCQIAARSVGKATRSLRPKHGFIRGSSRWDWSRLQHQDLEHWLDDLSLYALCSDLEVTTPFRRTLGRLDQLRHAVVLSKALADTNRMEFLRIEIEDFLRACLSRLDLVGEMGSAPHRRPQNMIHALFHRNAIRHWRTFTHHLETLIESLGVIDDPECSHRFADRVCELAKVSQAALMQNLASSMYLSGLDGWRRVLVAGLDAPGDVPASVHTRSLKLLLSGELDLEIA